MKKLFLFFSFLLICSCYAKSENQSASASWLLIESVGQAASLSGQLEAAEITLQGLAVNAYSGPDASLRLSLAGGGSATWHTAEDANCYIEFSVSPKAGNKFYASEISAYVCGVGGGDVRANFYYSTDAGFAEKTQINFKKDASISRDALEQLQVAVDKTIEAGEKIYFRVYPYYKTASTGKYICLKDAVISGETEATEVAVSVNWPFISDLKPIVSGALLAQDMAYSSNAKQYAWDARVNLSGSAVDNGTFCTNTSNCLWTPATDIQEDVYIQYAVAPKVGATLTVKNLSLMIAATATNSLYAAIYVSKDADFATKTKLKDITQLANTELEAWDIPLTTPEVVNSGETFYVRVYPFNKSAADITYKLIGVRNVTISGTMIGATADPAEVSTVAAATYISTLTALAGGSVTNDGGAPVTARGMVWNTSANPTIDHFKTIDGDGAGIFESTLTGLAAGTKYYARAYATNKAGTSYGAEINFTTLAELVVPAVQTLATSNLRNTSVVVSGRVTAWGGTSVTERGIVWGTETNPTANKIVAGSDIGTFQGYIDGLTPETKYYVRAYATNQTGTAYGNELSVTTKATDPDVTKIIAPDGAGDYTTVQAAFDAVPADYTGRWIIRIKPGTYTERPSLAKGKVNVYLVGEDAATTIITHNTFAGMAKPGGGTWGTSGCQTMEVLADDFMAVNITIANTFANSKANAATNSDTQGVALKTQGDRQSFYNCRITGYQDTYLGNSIGRAYFKDCYVEGNVDFIFGRQTVVFDQCTTYVNRTGSVLTAPSTEKTTKFGMVFLDCNITAPSTSYSDFNGDKFKEFYYGRPWQQQPRSAFIRCEVPATLNEKGWTTMSGGLNPVFVEYACIGDGATADRLSKRGNEGKVLTAGEAAIYTVENVFKKDTDPSFAADWMPKAAPDADLITSIGKNAISASKSYSTPNPFTDSFTVHYALAANSNVVINLYNINGVLLKKLADSTQGEGAYAVECDGSQLPSGVYYYTIQLGNSIETHKLIKR
ncbi:pectinesterase family protein [Viscerimonas tarda]